MYPAGDEAETGDDHQQTRRHKPFCSLQTQTANKHTNNRPANTPQREPVWTESSCGLQQMSRSLSHSDIVPHCPGSPVRRGAGLLFVNDGPSRHNGPGLGKHLKPAGKLRTQEAAEQSSGADDRRDDVNTPSAQNSGTTPVQLSCDRFSVD